MFGLIVLFILLLALGMFFIVIGIRKLDIPRLILGTVVIIISIVPVSIADIKMQKQMEDNIRERCLESNGEIVEYKETKFDPATKTNRTMTELFCLKDGQLNK